MSIARTYFLVLTSVAASQAGSQASKQLGKYDKNPIWEFRMVNAGLSSIYVRKICYAFIVKCY